MSRLKAEYFTQAQGAEERRRQFKWFVPEDVSGNLDAARAAAKKRATDAGWKVRSVNFTRGSDGEVSGIVVYVQRGN